MIDDRSLNFSIPKPNQQNRGTEDVERLRDALDLIDVLLNGMQAASDKGAPDGYPGLDNSGMIPAALLPSSVIDVLEYETLALFPGSGAASKIYLDSSNLRQLYRWNGSAFVGVNDVRDDTDDLPEGTSNLYYTDQRVLDIVQEPLDNAAAVIPTLLPKAGGVMTGGLEVPAGAAGDQVARVSELVTLAGAQTIAGAKTYSAKVTIAKAEATTLGAASGGTLLELQATSGASFISFHRTGSCGINLGLSDDNVFRLGGWSQGLNTYRFSSDTAGNFTASGNSAGYSDERLKTNWKSLPPDFTSRLAKVKSGSYDRIDTELTQVGVSAQSLQKLMPEAVLTDENGTLSVAYGNAALAACVELAKEIVELKAQIKQLKGD